MIKFLNSNNSEVYEIFRSLYRKALNANQQLPEAISISSFNKEFLEVNARFVNLKIVDNEDFIFFTNYNSSKAEEFNSHNQIAALIYWSSINVQIRIKAKIRKTSEEFNKKYFFDRSEEKNALAISSNQSKLIDSYNQVKENYNKSLKNDDLKKCPDFWGGYSFTPYYFAFWEGHESRINKREVFNKIDDVWEQSFLQP